MILLLALAACEPAVKTVPDDTGGDTGAPSTGATLVIATVASDFSVGQLATLDADGRLTDALLPTTTDPVVESDGDRVILLDRSSENTLRLYDPADWSAPLVELSTGDASNPQDAARCGDTLVVSVYAGADLLLFDVASGLARGTVDLSAWADADGSPEANGIITGADGDLYVALHRLDTTRAPWMSADGTGTILRLDCDTLAVTAEWTTGPNPALLADPADPDTLLVRTGLYFNTDYSLNLDGDLRRFDPAAGTLSAPLLTEADFGRNLGALAGHADGKSILVADDGYSWGVWCVDLATGEATATDPADSYIGDAVTGPDGRAWVAYRAGYAGNGAPVIAGLVPWDPATCTAGDPVATLFPPYSLARVSN